MEPMYVAMSFYRGQRIYLSEEGGRPTTTTDFSEALQMHKEMAIIAAMVMSLKFVSVGTARAVSVDEAPNAQQ